MIPIANLQSKEPGAICGDMYISEDDDSTAFRSLSSTSYSLTTDGEQSSASLLGDYPSLSSPISPTAVASTDSVYSFASSAMQTKTSKTEGNDNNHSNEGALSSHSKSPSCSPQPSASTLNPGEDERTEPIVDSTTKADEQIVSDTMPMKKEDERLHSSSNGSSASVGGKKQKKVNKAKKKQQQLSKGSPTGACTSSTPTSTPPSQPPPPVTTMLLAKERKMRNAAYSKLMRVELCNEVLRETLEEAVRNYQDMADRLVASEQKREEMEIKYKSKIAQLEAELDAREENLLDNNDDDSSLFSLNTDDNENDVQPSNMASSSSLLDPAAKALLAISRDGNLSHLLENPGASFDHQQSVLRDTVRELLFEQKQNKELKNKLARAIHDYHVVVKLMNVRPDRASKKTNESSTQKKDSSKQAKESSRSKSATATTTTRIKT